MKRMKKSGRPISRRAIYFLLGLLFAVLILAAVFAPQIIYGIYDNYQYHLSSKADRNQLNTAQLDAIYETDRGKRLSAYTGGYFLGKRYLTVETDVADGEELDGTVKGLVMELNELLFQTDIGAEQFNETMDSNQAAGDVFFFYTLGDFIPLGEALLYTDSSSLYADVDRASCRRFLIYDESMSDGIAFSLLYMKIELGADFQIELLGDTYDSTIYYMKIQYPDELLEGLDEEYWLMYEGKSNVAFGRCFREIMAGYYDAETAGSETVSMTVSDSMSCSENLTFGDYELAAEIKMWSEGGTGTVNRLGVGIRQIADAVGVMEIP